MNYSLNRKVISCEGATALVEAAVSHARGRGWNIAAAVTDPSGGLVAFARMDGAGAPIGDFALDKAYTAGSLGKSSKSFGERMAGNPTLSLGLSTREGFIAWGGGVAIYEGEDCIGGLGVSGVQEHEDIECAETVLRQAGLDPR